MLTYKERVKIALIEKGLSIEEISEKINVSIPTIHTVLNETSVKKKSHAREIVREYIEKKLGIKS